MITEDAVRAAEVARTIAMTVGDLDALDQLLHAELRYGHTSATYDTKARYLEKFRTGELLYPQMTTTPVAFAQLGESVAVLWVRGNGRVVTPLGEKTLQTAALTLWTEVGAHRLQMIAHQPTKLPG